MHNTKPKQSSWKEFIVDVVTWPLLQRKREEQSNQQEESQQVEAIFQIQKQSKTGHAIENKRCSYRKDGNKRGQGVI